MWFPLNSRKVGFLVVFLLNVIFSGVNIEIFKDGKIVVGYLAEASESSSSPSMTKLDAERKLLHPGTSMLPRYPVPGMRYDELPDSGSDSGNTHKKRKSKDKSKSKGSEKSGQESEDLYLESDGKDPKKKSKSGSKSSRSSKLAVETESGGGSLLEGAKAEAKPSKSKSSKRKSSRQKAGSSDKDSFSDRGRRFDDSKLVMSEYKSYSPGVKDMIWQDPGSRKTYKHLNIQYGDYFPKIATKPYRKSNECSSLFDSARKAYLNREIMIHPADFVGLSLTLAKRLRDVLGQYVTIQDSCLMLRMFLHLYSGMRTRAQFLNVVAAVLQNDVLLGRLPDETGLKREVSYVADLLLQIPKHRADTKSKQMSAIELWEFFHLDTYPKDNSFESRLFPFYRSKGEKLMSRIEKKLGITVARDEVMSVLYIMLNFVEEERSQEQCVEILKAVIGATHTSTLSMSQLSELEKMSRDILGCKKPHGKTMSKEQIMDVFGPEKTVVEMRQKTLVGDHLSEALWIWKEVGTLDYLGRVLSVRFNDCDGLKAWQLNRICSMMEVMNKKLIKTGSTKEVITLEELCGAFKYKTRHSGTKWTLAIKTVLQQRQNALPVKVEKLFSHFLSHEKKRLASLEGSTKRRREVFYSVPEFSKPSFLDAVTPASPAQGIPPADPRKPDFFYTFNSMPRWLQNRFVFASAFMEETLLRFGNFLHISPVRLYNGLGGRLDETSDLSLVLTGSSLTQDQYRVLPAAFCDYEKKMMSEHNLSSGSSLSREEFLQAFYEYPLAKYVEGRYFIEAGVDIAEILTAYLDSSVDPGLEVFQQLATQEGLNRVYCFQAFVNSRIKGHFAEENISFITVDDANRILSGCVDRSKLSYIHEMRSKLSYSFFTDSMIEILASDWVEYEGSILPRVLGLDPSGDGVTLGSIYSSGVTFATLSADGWELLVDPAIPLLTQSGGTSFILDYSTNSLHAEGPRENRARFINDWTQLYFLYKLGRIPTFNLEQVRALVEIIPNTTSLSREEILAAISIVPGLSFSSSQSEELCCALEAYFFYEKFFIFAKSFDLESSFAMGMTVANGKLHIPSYVWSFLRPGSASSSPEITDPSVLRFAETAMAYLTKMFVTQPQNQDLFIKVVQWANRQNLNDDSIFSDSRLSITDFLNYIQHNTGLRHNPLAFLVPWVDHYSSGFQFRRLKALPVGTSPGFSPLGGREQEDRTQSADRAREILSEIERLGLEYSALLKELSGQIVSEDSGMLVVEKIRSDIHALLSELGTVSSSSVSSALLILSKSKIFPSIGVSDEQRLAEMGLQVGENGQVIFDERLAKRGLAGVLTPSLVLGTFNPATGVLEGPPPPDFDPGLSYSVQNVNRMQAFRLWWNSVQPKMPFHCSDPLLARDLQSVGKLLPVFVRIGFVQDEVQVSGHLVGLTTSHPFPTSLDSMQTIARSFLADEQAVLLALSPPARDLEEAYRDLRMIAGFYSKKTTLPLLGVPMGFSFTPDLEIPDADDLENLDRTSSAANARANLLDYLERLTAEYFASSPRRMPTIGIPRLNNLAMNFSNDRNRLVLLISSIFGPKSPYISAPSIGASALHLAEFYIANMPFSEEVDSVYVEAEFRNSRLEFGSPREKLRLTTPRSDLALLDFGWTSLSSHLYSTPETYFNSFLAMSELLTIALTHASSKTGVSVYLSSEALKQISFSFVTGQNLLEAFGTSAGLSDLGLEQSARNKFISVLAKSFSFLLSYLSPLLEHSPNRDLAESILQSATQDLYTAGFYPEGVRHEIVERLTLFIDLDLEKYQILFSDMEDSLSSAGLLALPKSLVPHPHILAPRFLTQSSDPTIVSGLGIVSRTPICNFALTFAYFFKKTLERPQNKNKIVGFDPAVCFKLSLWSGICGVSSFESVDYKSMILSTIKNISARFDQRMGSWKAQKILLLLDFFDQNIRELVIASSPDLSPADSNETLFSDLDLCFAAVDRFFAERDITVDDLQMSNSPSLSFQEDSAGRHSHFSLLSRQESAYSRVRLRSMLEDLFISGSQHHYEIGIQPGLERQISASFFSGEPLVDGAYSSQLQPESLSDLFDRVPFELERPKLKFGKKEEGSSSRVFSYLDVDKEQRADQHFEPGAHSFLAGKKICNVNRAVFFQHWWLLVWQKIPFYAGDLVLGELLSRLDVLSEVFQTSGMLTSPEVIFGSVAARVAGIPGVSLKKSHIYLMIDAFLDSETKALQFSGARNLESAYSSDSGMLDSLLAIDHAVPRIPVPKGRLGAMLGPERTNLAQYLFRLISEYFAASPRRYPTILIPSTAFLASYFELDRSSLTYLIYVWSDLDSENSIRAFFQAPTIGASFEDLADFIIENFRLNFLRVGSSYYLQFFSDSLFSTYFKFGSPLFRVSNVELGLRCSTPDGSCSPLTLRPRPSDSARDSLVLILTRCLYLASTKMSLAPDSDLLKFFSALDVAESILLGINILDAVRVHGFGSQRLQTSLVELNKFTLLISKHFSRFFSLLLDHLHTPHPPAASGLGLAFPQTSTLLARSFNILSRFSSELDVLTALKDDSLDDFLKTVHTDDIVAVERYRAFFGVSVSDEARGIMTVGDASQDGDDSLRHLSVTRFNYVYCFLLFLVHVLARIGSSQLHISFRYHDLLRFENVVRATAISNHEGVPEAVFTLISHRDRFSLGSLTLTKLKSIYSHFKTRSLSFLSGNSVHVVFTSSDALAPFVRSLSGLSRDVRLEGDVLSATYSGEFPPLSFDYYVPRSQALLHASTTETILNSNFRLDLALSGFQETSFITGSYVKPWVPFLPGLSSQAPSSAESSEASGDRLSLLDPGHVYLRRKLKTRYTLSQSVDLTLPYNSLVDLGPADLSSGTISLPTGHNRDSVDGLEVFVLNRAVLFREWLIRAWSQSPEISRDPLVLEFLNDFGSLINIFVKTSSLGGEPAILFITMLSHFVSKTGSQFAPLAGLFKHFTEFEERLVAETGYPDLRKALESGIAGLYLSNSQIPQIFPRRKCHRKNRAWARGGDSVRRWRTVEYVSQKLTEYFSAAPRSAFTLSLPDVSILVDNYWEHQPEKLECVILEWARDRPDLVSAPSLGLDPASISRFLLSFLSAGEEAQNDASSAFRCRLSYGLLDEPPAQDYALHYSPTGVSFSLREYDSLYERLVAPLLAADPVSLDAAAQILRSLARSVLDTHGINHHQPAPDRTAARSKKTVPETTKEETGGGPYADFSLALDYRTLIIRMLIGVSDSFSVRKLFEPVPALSSVKELNRVSSDFIRRLSVLRTCVYDSLYNLLALDQLSRDVTLSLQRSGLQLTEPETRALALNYVFVSFSGDILSNQNFVRICLSDFLFYQRPIHFSTLPDLGPVSQQTGLLFSSFSAPGTGLLQMAFVPQVNLLVYFLKSLNAVINHPANRVILSIPASVNFLSTNAVLKLSRCTLNNQEGFSCLAEDIVNSLMERSVDIGNLTVEALKEILESLFQTVGDLSYGSSPSKHLDPASNKPSLSGSLAHFNPNILSGIFGDLESLERVVTNRFVGGFPDVRRLSKSLQASFGLNSLIDAQVAAILESSSRSSSLSLSLVNRLSSIPAVNRKLLQRESPPTLGDLLAKLGLSGVSELAAGGPGNVLPTLLKISKLVGDNVVSIKGEFRDTDFLVANRAATFHLFVHISTFVSNAGGGGSYADVLPSTGGKGVISLQECIRFFSDAYVADIQEAVPKISRHFGNIDFYKVYQLLDVFYVLEKQFFGLEAERVPYFEYSDPERLVSVADSFRSLALNLEMPQFDGAEAETLGKVIMLLCRKFFDDDHVRRELTLASAVAIARSFWPADSDYHFATPDSSSVGYYVRLALLQNLPSLRNAPRRALGFASFLNHYVYHLMGSDPGLADFSDPLRLLRERKEFLKKAFSRPFVCSEQNLPWTYPEMLYSGVSFPQFNFAMYLATAWRTYLELHMTRDKGPDRVDAEKWASILETLAPDLVSLIHTFSSGISLNSNLSLDFFSRLTRLLRGGHRSPLSQDELKTHVNDFLVGIQRFSRIRHPGVIDVSFMWPAVDCESSSAAAANPAILGKMIVPGLSFPLSLNNISSRAADKSTRGHSQQTGSAEFYVDSLGEFFPGSEAVQATNPTTDEQEDDRAQTQPSPAGKVRMGDLIDNKDDSSVVTSDE